METLEKNAIKKDPAVKYLIPLLLNLKKAWKMSSLKKKIIKLEGKKE